jgi:hypothetical protein
MTHAIAPFDAFAIVNMLTYGRSPDEVITDMVDGAEVPYLLRWFVKPKQEGEGNVYLHCFRRSDFDRALHDHPWESASILLCGEYLEHTPEGTFHRKAGDVVVREAEAQHRIQLMTNDEGTELPCWSLFITGPKVREWGFHCPQGFVHWTDFVANRC